MTALSSADDGLLTPVTRAMMALGSRAREGRHPGEYRLDGRPADIRQLVAEANRVLAEHGQQPIAYPGVLTVGGGR